MNFVFSICFRDADSTEIVEMITRFVIDLIITDFKVCFMSSRVPFYCPLETYYCVRGNWLSKHSNCCGSF